MAETDTDNSTTQRRRNKIRVTGGVGGIGGVLIIGGVIAVTNLLRNRASRKERDFNHPKTPVNVEEDEGEGLSSLNQSIGGDASGASSSQIGCDPQPEATVETPTMEDQPNIEHNEELTDEVPFNSDKFPLASSDRFSEAIKDVVPLTSSDGVAASENDEVLLVDDRRQLPSLPLQEEETAYSDDYTDDHDDNEEDDEESEDEEEEDNSDDEEEMEREREGSEGTGDSSIGSNSEAIWPAESIEKELLLMKDRAGVKVFVSREITNEQDSEKIAKAEEDEFELMNRSDTGLKLIHRPSLGFTMMLLLVVGLLYLLFAHHLPLLYNSKDSQLWFSS